MSDLPFHCELDTSGETCPKPILMARKQLKMMSAGQVLKIISTDPLSIDDFQIFSKMNHVELLNKGHVDGKFVFYLKK